MKKLISILIILAIFIGSGALIFSQQENLLEGKYEQINNTGGYTIYLRFDGDSEVKVYIDNTSYEFEYELWELETRWIKGMNRKVYMLEFGDKYGEIYFDNIWYKGRNYEGFVWLSDDTKYIKK